MLKIYINKLAVPARDALQEMRPVYTALRAAAIRENDLRTYIEADLALVSMNLAERALSWGPDQKEAPHYLKAEAIDSAEGLIWECKGFEYSPPRA